MIDILIITTSNLKDSIVEKIINLLKQNEVEVTELQIKEKISFSDLEIIPATRQVIYKGHEISFTTMEFDVLYFLALHCNQVCTPNQIYEAVSKEPYMAGSYIITNMVYRIRKKLSPQVIQTVRGLGYRFISEKS